MMVMFLNWIMVMVTQFYKIIELLKKKSGYTNHRVSAILEPSE